MTPSEPEPDPKPEHDPTTARDPNQLTNRELSAAAGLKSGRIPRFLTPPAPASFSNSPELRKLYLLGAGLVMLIVFTYLLMPRDSDKPTSGSVNDPVAALQAEPANQLTNEQRLATIFQGALLKVTDGADFDESSAYLELIRELVKYDPAEVHRLATREFDWNQAMKDPDSLRGEWVHTRGLLGGMKAVKIMTPVAGVSDVYRGVIADAAAESEPRVFDLVVHPAQNPDLYRDVVDVEGIFIRIVAYEPKKGSTPVQVPYLLVRNYSIYHPPERGLSGMRLWAVLGGVAAAAVLVAWLAMRREERPRHPGALRVRHGTGMRELFEMRLAQEGRRPPRETPPKT